MRNSGNTSTRLVRRLRGSCLTVLFLIGGSSAAAPSALGRSRFLLGRSRFLVERGDRVGQLLLHAADVGAAPADGTHPPSAQSPQRRQGPRVAEIAELAHPVLLLLAGWRL